MAAFVSSRCLPQGLLVERIEREVGCLTVTARSPAPEATCPSCGGRSRQVHRRYRRTLSDLPRSGRAMRNSVTVRRSRCTVAACPARVLAESLGDRVAAPFARRTARLDGSLTISPWLLAAVPAPVSRRDRYRR